MIALTLTCTSPLHHGAFSDEDTGNIVAFRRLPLALPDGRHVLIPHVSGNALRGMLRRVLMRDLLDHCRVNAELVGDRGYQRLYAALANGGHLDGSEASVQPDKQRALRAAIPPLSLFGAALYTYMLAGRFSSGILWPICQETVEAGVVPGVYIMPPDEDGTGGGAPLAMAEDLIAEYSHTRHIERSEHDPAVSGVTPMPVTIEVMIPGTTLRAHLLTSRCTDLEASALVWACERIEIVGAKGASGLGRVVVGIESEHTSAAYAEWRIASREPTRLALMDLAGDLGAEKKAKGKSK